MRRVFAFQSHYQKIKSVYNKYERWLMPVTLATGFLADYITFVNIQVKTAIIILFVHFTFCGLAIVFIHAFDAGRIPERFKYIRLFAPLVVQFTFGGLLSNSFIFYWFSGSLWVSWPFIFAFVALMVSNDTLRHHFLRPTVQLAVYFFATFSIFSVSLPFIFNSVSPLMFILSGILSPGIISVFIWVLVKIAGAKKFDEKNIAATIIIILVVTNLFYFFNLIPPVPLSVREAGVYHSVSRAGASYTLRAEKENIWDKLIPGQTIHLNPGERAFVYSAIYAPSKLNTKIVHEWQYYDDKAGKWVVKDKLSFNLIGGRRGGFRGYSLKTDLAIGYWRVYIKTERGQTMDRVKFKIERPEGRLELVEISR